jgi:hypothetical protein
MGRPQNEGLDSVELHIVQRTSEQGEDRSPEEQNHPEEHLLISIAHPRNKTNQHNRSQHKYLNEINQTAFCLGITVCRLDPGNCFGGPHQRSSGHSSVIAWGS